MRVRQESRHLPALALRERAHESRRAGKPDTMCHFPESDAVRRVRHAFSFPELGRSRTHALRDRVARVARQAVADRAVLLVEPRPGEHRIVVEREGFFWAAALTMLACKPQAPKAGSRNSRVQAQTGLSSPRRPLTLESPPRHAAAKRLGTACDRGQFSSWVGHSWRGVSAHWDRLASAK